ncbi:MAG: tRNA lysidine(34) synthetase TilS [Firmicutes bacterium]|nr:tRNA lysidine(34) synthetase TilS [Bacillota bacterium]
MLQKVQTTINRYKLLSSGDKVLVGVSGGPDSVALLHCLVTLAPVYGFQLQVIHVNHMFRGEEAAADAAFVKDLCEQWNIPVSIQEINVPALVAETKSSPQAVGREVRLALFEQVSREIGANKIALGHHADDQAETVLMHLLRGAAAEGLGGMYPRRGQIIRPLLEVRRVEIEQYCREHGLSYRIDSSNQKAIYLRNRVRLHLIPLLQAEYNPNIVTRLNEMAELLRDEQQVLFEQTRSAFARTVTQQDEQWMVDLDEFSRLPTALQRRITREIYARLTGSTHGLKFKDTEKVLALVRTGVVGKVAQLPRNVCFSRGYGMLIARLGRVGAELKREEGEYMLTVPGCTVLPTLGLKVTAALMSSIPREEETGENNYRAYLDWEKVDLPLYLRFRRPGDVFQPLGTPGRKKLKEFFIDAKIPRAWRDQIPLIASREAIYWVVGYRLDERCRVTAQTRQIMCIQVEKIQPNQTH